MMRIVRSVRLRGIPVESVCGRDCKPMRHDEGSEAERKKATRLTNGAYVHFRVMYDHLSQMPAKAAHATNKRLHDVAQCVGDLEHVAEYLPLRRKE